MRIDRAGPRIVLAVIRSVIVTAALALAAHHQFLRSGEPRVIDRKEVPG